MEIRFAHQFAVVCNDEAGEERELGCVPIYLIEVGVGLLADCRGGNRETCDGKGENIHRLAFVSTFVKLPVRKSTQRGTAESK
jgi:hypothetical protein